jgi:hypothetical protein
VRNDDPEMIEVSRHYDKQDKVPLPETLHEMKDLFYANQEHWNQATM